MSAFQLHQALIHQSPQLLQLLFCCLALATLLVKGLEDVYTPQTARHKMRVSKHSRHRVSVHAH